MAQAPKAYFSQWCRAKNVVTNAFLGKNMIFYSQESWEFLWEISCEKTVKKCHNVGATATCETPFHCMQDVFWSGETTFPRISPNHFSVQTTNK